MNKEIRQLLKPKQYDEVSLTSNNVITSQKEKKSLMSLNQKKYSFRSNSLMQNNSNISQQQTPQKKTQFRFQALNRNSHLKYQQVDFEKAMVSSVIKDSKYKENYDQFSSIYNQDFNSIQKQIQSLKNSQVQNSQNFFDKNNRNICRNEMPEKSFDDTLQIESEQEQQKEQEKIIQQIMSNYQNKISIDQIISDNQDFISHLFRLCKCFKCDCGRCVCEYEQKNIQKIKFRLGMSSIYNSDFQKKQKNQNYEETKIDQKTYSNPIWINSNNTQYYQSQNREQFYEKEIREKNPRFRHFHIKNNDIQLNQTNYNHEFKDWSLKEPKFQNLVTPQTIFQQTATQKSTYQQNFANFHEKDIIKNEFNHFKSPSLKNSHLCTPIIPQIEKNNNKLTTNNFDFQLPQNYNYNIPKRNIKQNYINPGNNKYDGMYKSVNKNDFQGNQEQTCCTNNKAYQQELRQQIIEKVNSLNLTKTISFNSNIK